LLFPGRLFTPVALAGVADALRVEGDSREGSGQEAVGASLYLVVFFCFHLFITFYE
jgi:hypothetical protein